MVVPKDAGFCVRELRSTNGVRVNGVLVRGDRELRDGDVIKAGATQLVFSAADDPNLEDALRHYRKFEKPLRERSTERDEGS
jgi:pSer/pThr/pTyr-binding forkhead associated (FHA) protein